MAEARPDTVSIEIDRNEPTELGSLNLSAVIGFGRLFVELVTDSYLYVTDVSNNDLQIYDISSPATPTLVGAVAAITGEVTNLSNSMALDPGGNYLYIAVGSDKVYALDVNTDPEIPTVANTWTLTETASAGATLTLDSANSMLFILSQAGAKLYHADISTPGTFASTGSISASNTVVSCQHGIVSPDGDYIAYPSGTLASPNQIGFIDISTPSSPTEGTPIALPDTIEDSNAITPTGGLFFTNTTQMVLIGNYSDSNSLTQYFWLIYNKGADWEAATLVSHDAVSGEISPTKNASACHGSLSVASHPELPVPVFNPLPSSTYVFVPIGEGFGAAQSIAGRLAVYDYPSGVSAPPLLRSSFRYSDVQSFGPFQITSGGTMAGIGSSLTGSPEVVATLTEPAGWTDITADVMDIPGISAAWGISGSGPNDRVANTGTLTFELNNSTTNSTAALGKYSPDHANLLPQFTVGRAVRLTVTDSASSVYWYGSIRSITPTAGSARSRRTIVTAVDYMDYLATAKIKMLAVEENIASGVAFLRLISRVIAQPESYTIQLTNNDTFLFAFDQMEEEETAVTTEIQSLCSSDRSYVYIQDGALTYEERTTRAATVLAGPDATLTDASLMDLEIEHSSANVSNLVQAKVFPREVTSSNVVLFTLQSSQEVLLGTSVTFDAPYSDPDQKAERVAGKSMVVPVASTDYTFNRNKDGSGTDTTATLSVAVDFGGNSATVTVTNNGSSDGHITLFQLRGIGIFSFEPVTVTATDENSRGQYGPSDQTYDMPYHSTTPVAEDAAQYLIDTYSSPRTFLRSITLQLNESSLLADFVAGNFGIGSLLRITETVTGLSASDHFVRSVDLTIGANKDMNAVLGLSPIVDGPVWLLETTGFTELDDTTTLASSFVS